MIREPVTIRRVTLKDIAQSVGVSVNAASKVLNNTRSNAFVSEDTRRRIVETAGRLGYQPNFAARSLTRRRTDAVAFYFDRPLDLSEPSTAAVIEGAEEGCQRKAQSLLIFGRRLSESIDDVSRKVLTGMADGIAFDTWTSRDVVDRLLQSGLPLVAYPAAHPDVPSITLDEDDAARRVIDRLRLAGHRRIYFRASKRWGDEHAACYRRAACDRGLDFHIMHAEGYGAVSADERALLSLSREMRPTAVICGDSLLTYCLIDYCRDNQLVVPNDLAIVGFDGPRNLPPRRQSITTIRVPWAELASAAVAALVDLRDGRRIPADTRLDIEIIDGETA